MLDVKSNINKSIKIIKSIFIILMLFVLGSNFTSAEKVEDLKVDKYINDYANIIDDNVEAALNNDLYDFYASTTNQVVVVTVNNIDGDYIEHYAIKLAEKIKAGGAQYDNGVILLISKDDKLIRIEVGYGLEATLTDSKSRNITDNILRPEFKTGNYTTGVQRAVAEIKNITSVAGYNSDNINKSGSLFSSGLLSFLSHMPAEIYFFLFFFGFTFLQWLGSVLGRTKSWWLGGAIGFVLALLVFIFVAKILFVFLLTFIGFVFDFAVSKNYKQHASGLRSGPPDWWAGGDTFGGLSRGAGWSSSSGGYSGGGGSFGGGGASGDW